MLAPSQKRVLEHICCGRADQRLVARHEAGTNLVPLNQLLQLSATRQVGSSRVRPNLVVSDLGVLVEVEDVCEGLVPRLALALAFHPREPRATLDGYALGLGIDDPSAKRHVLIREVLAEEVEVG